MKYADKVNSGLQPRPRNADLFPHIMTNPIKPAHILPLFPFPTTSSPIPRAINSNPQESYPSDRNPKTSIRKFRNNIINYSKLSSEYVQSNRSVTSMTHRPAFPF